MHPDKEEVEKNLVARGRRHQDLCFGPKDDSITRGQGCHRNYVGPFWKIPEADGRAYYNDPDRGNVSFHSKPNRQVGLTIHNSHALD
jgi:hypothetical protein